MGARLLCRTGEFAGNDFEIGPKATIGRHPDNEVVLPSATILERHACIKFDENVGCYYLENLGRKGKTWLDGREISERIRLSDLHVVTLSDHIDLIFCVTPESPGQTPETVQARPQRISVPQFGQAAPEATESRTLLQKLKNFALPASLSPKGGKQEDSLPGTARHRPAGLKTPSFQESEKKSDQPAAGMTSRDEAPLVLLIVDLPEGQRTLHLGPGEHFVGRAHDCEVCLDDPSLSRRHARIRLEQGKVWIQDLDSVNHTYVENVKLTGDTEVKAGESIRFGRIRARWMVPEG